MTEEAHAELGASSAHRWMVCPGSVNLSRGMPNTSGAAAHTGSAAHFLAEVCLLNGDDPWEYLGEQVPHEDYEDVEVDQTMVDAVTVYVDYCRRVTGKEVLTEDEVEVKLGLGALAGSDEDHVVHSMFGTGDLVAETEDTLYVGDYKNGSGVLVEVEGNPQPMYYAVGALLKRGVPLDKKVVCTIIQPNAAHGDGAVREVEYTPHELMDWAENELIPAAEATQEEDAPLHAGDHCKFCPAKPRCPKLKELRTEQAMVEFTDEGAEPMKKMDQLSDDEIRQILDARKDIEDWLKGVWEYAQEQLRQGEDVTGGAYELKAGRKKREFKDEEKTQKTLEQWGLNKDDYMTEPKLKSPAQVEKLIGKDRKPDLAKLIAETPGPKTMAKASNKRKGLKAGANADFE